ncbi:MAG: metal ABC transporter solute-binding protein, Zn/Mn family [bacterium]
MRRQPIHLYISRSITGEEMTMERGVGRILGALVMAVILFACAAGWCAPRLTVVTSIFPLQEFARAVGGERATVRLLLPPGAEPHTWEPRPSDILTIAKADFFIYIGSGLEPWARDILEGARRDSLEVVEIMEKLEIPSPRQSAGDVPSEQGVRNMPHKHAHTGRQHEGIDPHIWLDFRMDQRIVDTLADAFSRKDPEGASLYRRNASAYNERLAALDTQYAESLARCKRSEILVAGHAAFSYLVQRYGLEQISLMGMNPDAETKPREMAGITDYAKRIGICTIFYERLANDRLARVLAEEIGATIMVINPGANLTREERKAGITFIDVMKENLENLMKGLECE